MKVTTYYELKYIEISYGRRSLKYNQPNWEVTYYYDNKVKSVVLLGTDRYWKALHKHHKHKKYGFMKSTAHIEIEVNDDN